MAAVLSSCWCPQQLQKCTSITDTYMSHAIGRNPGGPSHLDFWTHCLAWQWCSCAYGNPQAHQFVGYRIHPPGPTWRPGKLRAWWIDQIQRDSSSSPVKL